MRKPSVVFTLVVINGVLFAATYLGPAWGGRMVEWFALWFPQHREFEWWQFLTSMFMHASLAHIFFNMFALASFGLPLQQIWGARRFLIFYLLCGLGAGAIYTAVNWFEFHSLTERLLEAGVSTRALRAIMEIRGYAESMTAPPVREMALELYQVYQSRVVGASGAIYGVLVAFGMMFPNAKLGLIFVPVPIAAKYFIPGLILLDLFSGVTGFSIFGGGIAHFAHIGGAIIGFLLMWFWRGAARRRRRETWSGFGEAV